MASVEEQFDRAVKRILREIEKHEERSIKDALVLAEKLRREVIADIAQATEFNSMVLQQLRASIEARVEEFRIELTNATALSQRVAFDLGVKLVDEPTAAIARSLTGVSREVLLVASQFSAALIGDLSASVREKISGILARAALGGLTPQQAIEQVGTKLDKGAFKSLAFRAETIVRTEVLRIQSIASHARMRANKESVNRAGYVMKKSWLSARDRFVRTSHGVGPLGADGQTREIDEPFFVGGEELMFPRDPKGSAVNTVNCRCASRPVIEKAETTKPHKGTRRAA